MEVLPLNTFIFRLVLALLLGACVGIERELKQRNAGLVTNALVSLGAATYILISIHVSDSMGGDPSRVLAQVVTGIGFLGAGLIIRDGFSVFGLNTAATVWCSAAVGCTCGFGCWKEALIATGAIIAAHFIFSPLVYAIEKRPLRNSIIKEIGYKITISTSKQSESEIRTLLMKKITAYPRFQIRSLTTSKDGSSEQVTIEGEILSYGRMEKELESVVVNLAGKPNVNSISWEVLKQTIDR